MTNHEHFKDLLQGRAAMANFLAKDDDFVTHVIDPWWCCDTHGRCPMYDTCKAYSDGEDCLCDWQQFPLGSRIMMWLDEEYHEN